MTMFKVFDVRCGSVVSRHRTEVAALKGLQKEQPSVLAVAAPSQRILHKNHQTLTYEQRIAFGDYVAL